MLTEIQCLTLRHSRARPNDINAPVAQAYSWGTPTCSTDGAIAITNPIIRRITPDGITGLGLFIVNILLSKYLNRILRLESIRCQQSWLIRLDGRSRIDASQKIIEVQIRKWVKKLRQPRCPLERYCKTAQLGLDSPSAVLVRVYLYLLWGYQ